ncbi:MAG: hypothetical protein QW584_04330 [Thermofilaceae archaeon]
MQKIGTFEKREMNLKATFKERVQAASSSTTHPVNLLKTINLRSFSVKGGGYPLATRSQPLTKTSTALAVPLNSQHGEKVHTAAPPYYQ